MGTKSIENSAFFLETLKENYNLELERHFFRSDLIKYRIQRFAKSKTLRPFHLLEIHQKDPNFLYSALAKYKSEILEDTKYSLQEREDFKATVEELFSPDKFKQYLFPLELFHYSPVFKNTNDYAIYKDLIISNFKKIGSQFNVEMLVEESFKNLNHEIMPETVMKTKYKASDKLGYIVYADVKSVFNNQDLNLNVLCTQSALDTHILGTKITSSTRTDHFGKMLKNKRNQLVPKENNILLNLSLEPAGYKVSLSDIGAESNLDLSLKDKRLSDDPKRLALMFQLINVLRFLEGSNHGYLLNLADEKLHRRS